MQDLLNGLLEEETVQNAASASSSATQAMRQVRHLILRNKADILGKEDKTANKALQLYQEALGIDNNDASLLNKMGTLVCC